MKAVPLGLQEQVVGTYDQTKTTIAGRIAQKTITGTSVLGAPLSGFIDIVTDTAGGIPIGSQYITDNGRMFTIIAIATGTCTVSLHDFNFTTGAYSYVGKMVFALPNTAATTHTVRGLKVIDTGTTGWKLYLLTIGSVVPNGGLFLVNNLALADFSQVVQPTIPAATGNDQRAVYFLQDPNSLVSHSVTVTVAIPGKVQYVSHPYMNNDQVVFVYGTLPTGLALNTTYFIKNATADDFELSTTLGGVSITTTGSSGTAQITMLHFENAGAGLILDNANNKIYVHNGVAATHQYRVRDITVAPQWSSTSVTVTVAAPGKVQYTGHPYANNDTVWFVSGTLPTGLALNTPYFVRNATANDFEVSATTGGVGITTTGSSGTADVGTAWARTGSQFLLKTNNLPVLTGVLLLTDSEKNVIPVSGHLNIGVLGGNSCAFFATTTALYLGLLSELTSNATTWPSLTTANVLGGINEVVVPIPAYATWGNETDSIIYATTVGNRIIIKKLVNNAFVSNFGGTDNKYLETTVIPTLSTFGSVTAITISAINGWLFLVGGTLGQRGVYFQALTDDYIYDTSYIISKVIHRPNSILNKLFLNEVLYNYTGEVYFYYRTSGFGSISGGWTLLDNRDDNMNIPITDYVQFKIMFQVQSGGFTNAPQIIEALAAMDDASGTSDNWEFSHTHTSNGVPTRSAFRLRTAYSTVVPTLYFRAHEVATNTLLINHNTVTNAANFEYSTTAGVSWLPLGTISNVVGTLIRYTFTSPPGVEVEVGIKEE